LSVGERYTSARGGAKENIAWETQSVGYITSRDANPWGDSRGIAPNYGDEVARQAYMVEIE